MIDLPTQGDAKAWCWVDGDMPNDWRSRLKRAAVVVEATADPQVWLGIDTEQKCLDGRTYTLGKGGEDVPLENGLVNGGFEGPYTERDHASEVKVCEGWNPWHNLGQTRPEFSSETRDIGKGRVKEGDFAQKMFTSFANHDAGVWQRIEGVEPGEWYVFTVWLHIWVSNEDNPDVSTGQYHGMAFANGWGHWPEHYATIYGKEVLMDVYDMYTPVSVLFQAWGDTVSVGIRGKTQNAYKHNDLYIDKAELCQVQVYIDEEPPDKPPPEPPPQPGEPVDYAKFRGIVEEVNAGQTSELMLFLETGTTMGKLTFGGDE